MRRLLAVVTFLVLAFPVVVMATQPLCELNNDLAVCPTSTTTYETTTTTTEASTTTVGEDTTTTMGEETTTTLGEDTTTTLVEVNPICIDCNNATQADLQQLTGVNATLALAIIANRPYETLDDLVTKGVMTPGQLLLILVVNLGTGAFAGPECLSLVPPPPPATTTTILATTTTTFDGLPVTGADSMGLLYLALAMFGTGSILIGSQTRRTGRRKKL